MTGLSQFSIGKSLFNVTPDRPRRIRAKDKKSPLQEIKDLQPPQTPPAA